MTPTGNDWTDKSSFEHVIIDNVADITIGAFNAKGSTDGGTTWVPLKVGATGILDVRLTAGTAEVGKLAAGTAVIGKVGIDQTTPGTTNAVQIAAGQLGQALAAASVPVVLASDVVVGVAESGTAVAGTHSAAGATADQELVADPGAGVTIYVRGLTIQNTGATPDTFQLETDTAGAKTAVGPVFTVAAGATLNLVFGGPGLPCTVHKNLGYTSTGTAAYVLVANGVAR